MSVITGRLARHIYLYPLLTWAKERGYAPARFTIIGEPEAAPISFGRGQKDGRRTFTGAMLSSLRPSGTGRPLSHRDDRAVSKRAGRGYRRVP